eukprot:s2305_g5.t1
MHPQPGFVTTEQPSKLRLTTVCGAMQAFIFQDWSWLLVFTVIWSILVLIWLESSSKSAGAGTNWLPLAMAVPFLGYPCYWVSMMPYTWESDLWTGTIHEMFSAYYLAAGFWKLNADFLDPLASCAGVFFSQHVTRYFGTLSWESQVELGRSVLPWVPLGRVAVEVSMGLVFLLGRLDRRCARLGLPYILCFHLWVCLTPEPNNISLFAVQCASRLTIVLDPSALQAASMKIGSYAFAFSALGIVAVACGIQANFTPLNWGFLVFIPLFLFMHLVVFVETGTKAPTSPGTRSRRRPWWTYLATGFAWAYSFGTIMLGVMEEATPNMFANLKIHGGSNHLLLPTGLLFKWFGEAGDSHPYGGGVIRMENTTSSWLQTIYPCDLTHVLQPSAAPDLLEVLGSPRPVFLNSGANRILGLREKGFVPPPPHGKLLQYTTPAVEWKRLLKEAIEKDRSFAVTYSHLPGIAGDEVWRATSYARRVLLELLALRRRLTCTG